MVFSNAIFHWIADHDRLFARLRAALKPGGAPGRPVRRRGQRRRAGARRSTAPRGDRSSRRLRRTGPPPWNFAAPEETEERLRGGRLRGGPLLAGGEDRRARRPARVRRRRRPRPPTSNASPRSCATPSPTRCSSELEQAADPPLRPPQHRGPRGSDRHRLRRVPPVSERSTHSPAARRRDRPEIVAAARRLLEALGEFEFDERLMGGCSIDAHGVALTDEVLDACRAADAVLLGAVGGPKWDTTDPDAPRPEQGLLGLRKGMGLYANLRPVRPEPGAGRLQPAARGADRRHRPARRPRADRRHLLRRQRPRRRRRPRHLRVLGGRDRADRPRRLRGRAAPRRGLGRKPRVTSVDKANVLETSRLWREVVGRVAAGLPRRRARPPAGRQRRDAARLPPGRLRRDRHREPLRRHPQRRVGDADRLARDAALGQPRRRGRARASSSRSTAPPPTSPARASPTRSPPSSRRR